MTVWRIKKTDRPFHPYDLYKEIDSREIQLGAVKGTIHNILTDLCEVFENGDIVHTPEGVSFVNGFAGSAMTTME